MDHKNLKITCFGAGFVGLPTSSVLALNNPDSQVHPSLFSLLFMIFFHKK